jgi:hypothetical protein
MSQLKLSRAMARVVVLILLGISAIESHQKGEDKEKFVKFKGKLLLAENKTFTECQKQMRLLDDTAISRSQRSWAEESESNDCDIT